jgi:respiratory burst oxidase
MKDSDEFATELFDALARRQGVKHEYVTLTELQDFWARIANQSFDSRVQMFFDM